MVQKQYSGTVRPERFESVKGLDAARKFYWAVRAGASTGRRTVNAVPRSAPLLLECDVPDRERTRIDPPCFSIICLLTHSPRPEPVASLVVKSGSKMRGIVAGSMPLPSSATVTLIRGRLVLTQVDFVTRSLMVPLFSMASRLLTKRLEKTCRSSPATATM